MEVQQQRQKQKLKSDQDKLNELIYWYDKNKPQAGKVIQVRIEEKDLKKFAVPIPNESKRFAYRGRILERV